MILFDDRRRGHANFFEVETLTRMHHFHQSKYQLSLLATTIWTLMPMTGGTEGKNWQGHQALLDWLQVPLCVFS
jgi:hypothetical protein